MIHIGNQNQPNMRSPVLKLRHPLRNTCCGQKKLPYMSRAVWNSFSTKLRLLSSLNNFKHKFKKHFFEKLRNREQDILGY